MKTKEQRVREILEKLGTHKCLYCKHTTINNYKIKDAFQAIKEVWEE